MPTIVAVCPYCRRGGVRAPERAVGAVATCPKCGSHFTVVPTDDPPPIDDPTPLPAPRPAAPPTDETRPHATAEDVTEPSPVLPPDPPPVPRPPVVVSAPADESAAAADFAQVVALGSLLLFGAAMLATLFPYGRAVGLGLAGVGAVAGLVCLVAEGRARLIAAAGAVLNLGTVALLALAPGWLGLDPWQAGAADDAPTGPQAIRHDTGIATAADWVDAAEASWGFRDVRVTVHSVALAPVELVGPKGAKRRTKEQYLRLALRVSNEGVERRIELSGWAVGAGTPGVRLTDPAGTPLQPKVFDQGWEPARPGYMSGLFPGKAAEVPFTFEAPAARVEYLRLELPGAAVGLEEPIRFQLPWSAVAYRRGP